MLQTDKIDIGHIEKILKNCPNYDIIVHYEYPYGDVLSKMLIEWYRELIFSANGKSDNQMILIKVLDRILYLYVKDNKYKRGLRKIISTDDLTFKNKETVKDVIKKLITYTDNYENQEVREFTNAKWL